MEAFVVAFRRGQNPLPQNRTTAPEQEAGPQYDSEDVGESLHTNDIGRRTNRLRVPPLLVEPWLVAAVCARL